MLLRFPDLSQESLTISEESLKIFGDQNLKLERRNQDLQDSKMCKTCCHWSCSNKVSEVRNEVQSDLERENKRLQVCESLTKNPSRNLVNG